MAYYVSSALDANVAPGPLAIRAGVSPANVDRAVASIDEEVARLRRRRPDAAGARRVAPLPDRLDPARARDQRRDRELPAGRRVLRPRPRLRRAAARSAERGHDGRRQRRRPPRARSRSRDGRHRGALRVIDDSKAVLFDVDFTLIYPGPTFRGEGYQAFCARYGMDVDPAKFEAGVAQRGAAAPQPGRCLRPGDLHRLHQRDHRGDGRHRAARRRVLARDLPRVGRLPALRAVRRRAGGDAAVVGCRACASA